MYSTLPIVEVASQLWRGSAPAEPHPVAFNLPALDPANVMLSPILAHEVGHAAWKQGLDKKLDSVADLATASTHLRTAAAGASTDPRKLAELFDSWRQELLCDALAAVLTGPSFLFASSVFLPVTAGAPAIGSHPYPRDRVAYTLRILDQLGWTPTIEREVPTIYKWCAELSRNVALNGDPIETGLRAAIQAIEPAITETAINAATNAIDRSSLEGQLHDIRDWLAIEVPPVELAGIVPSPWEVIAAAWLCELRRLGDLPEAMAIACFDVNLNGFLVKSIELSGIRRIWSEI